MGNRKSKVKRETNPQLSKEDLERGRIELEIKDLERPFWKRPTYVLAGLPTLLAVVTLSVGMFNGYFSVSQTKLENQKHDLEAQVKDFEAMRDELHIENEQLKKEKELHGAKIADLKQDYEGRLAKLETRNSLLEKSNKTLSTQKDNIYKIKKNLEKQLEAQAIQLKAQAKQLKAQAKLQQQLSARLRKMEDHIGRNNKLRAHRTPRLPKDQISKTSPRRRIIFAGQN